MAINKHWIDEDFAWSVRLLSTSLIPYVNENFNDYTQKEHILFLADIICAITIKYGTSRSETGMVHILLNNLCNEWPEDQHSMLASLIKERLNKRRRLDVFREKANLWLSGNLDQYAEDKGSTKLSPRFDSLHDTRLKLVEPTDVNKKSISDKLRELAEKLIK